MSLKSKFRMMAVAAAAAAVSVPAAAGVSDPTPGTPGREFLIQTTGATALNQFTSTQNDNRGTILLGSASLVIGDTTYTAEASSQPLGVFNKGSISGNEPNLNADRLVYSYHNTGSINGILDLVFTNGLASGTPLAVGSTNAIFVNGFQSTLFPFAATASTNRYSNYYDATPNTAPIPIVGGFYDSDVTRKPFPQIAYSDVRTEQAFAQTGSSAFDRAPLAAGYGNGEPLATSGKKSQFQQLRNVGALTGGLNPSTTHLRNESLAAVPFTLSASPGTGLDGLTEKDFQFLQVRGRLQNGANFEYVTRDIGSGTRNQGGNNLNIDPSWTGGERDRVYLGSATYTTNAESGAVATVASGDEQRPAVTILASTGNTTIAEHRPSLLAKNSDKTSGTGGIRVRLLSSRMSLGILSTGDVNDTNTNTLRGGDPNTTNPLRVLALDFEDKFGAGEAGAGEGFLQPTAANVTTGKYQLWSASQAITVAGSKATGAGRTGGTLGLVANDTSAPNGRPILNDIDDDGTGRGIVRKFLDNVTGSITQGLSTSAATPFEALLLAAFIPEQLMQVTKPFDGGIQTSRALSTVDPDGAGPGVSPADLYNLTVGNPESTLNAALTFVRAGDHNGSISGQRYRVYDIANTQATAGNMEITFTARTFLAGDLNGDGVRDLQDVESWARAYANPSGFLDADTTGIDSGQAVSTTNNTGAAGFGQLNLSAVTTPTAGGRRLATLLPLVDLDGDGNVVAVSAGGADVALDESNPATYAAFVAAAGGNNDRVVAITRDDVEYFLFGATIDTGTGSAQQRREIGVRTGELKINEAVSRFNTAIDGVAGLTAVQKDDLKFELRDLNRSGTKAFANATVKEYGFLADAFLLDSEAGKDYTDLEDTLSTPNNLARFDIADGNTVIGQDDMDVMNAGLTTTAGVNPIGRVDHTWAAVTTKTGSTNIVVAPATGTVVVPAGGVFNINGGTFTAGGTVDIFTAGGNSLSVVNNADLVIAAGSKKLTALTGTGDTTIAAGATLVLGDPSQGSFDVEGSLEVLADGGVAGTLYTGALTIGLAGLVTLNDNDLVVDYTGSSPLAALVAAQLAGQLVSAADFGGVSTTLVLFEAADFGLTEFNTFALDSGDAVIGKFTYTGDSNLDGQVNAFDYSIVDDNFGNAGTFVTGDLNGDGFVDSFDYSAIDDTFGAGVGSPLRPAASTEVFIPEPSSLGLLALAGGLLARRRRA